jgi:hypothetical protein
MIMMMTAMDDNHDVVYDDQYNMPVVSNIFSKLKGNIFNRTNILTDFCGAMHISKMSKLPEQLTKLHDTAQMPLYEGYSPRTQ